MRAGSVAIAFVVSPLSPIPPLGNARTFACGSGVDQARQHRLEDLVAQKRSGRQGFASQSGGTGPGRTHVLCGYKDHLLSSPMGVLS
jgi:hypothetical protein